MVRSGDSVQSGAVDPSKTDSTPADAWSRLKRAERAEEFALIWLEIQSEAITGVRCGVVVLGPKGRGPFAPVAVRPAGTSGSRPLAEVVEKAITDRKSLSNYFTIGRDGWTRLPLLATTPDLFVFNPPIIRHAVMRDLPTLGPPLITRD